MKLAPRNELIQKLRSHGMAQVEAESEVARVLTMSPSDGAGRLKQLGLEYLDCFKLLSVATVDEIQSRKNERNGLVKNPTIMILAGGVLVLIGGSGVMGGFLRHSNAAIIDHGITLLSGISCCVWVVMNSQKR